MSETYNFPKPNAPFETLEELVRKTHEWSQDSKNVRLLSEKHAQEQKKKRNVTSRQIFEVLRSGKGISGPTLDEHGDWRIKLKKFTAGRVVQVVVVVKKNYLIVVTVI